jgi:hypothetical protein
MSAIPAALHRLFKRLERSQADSSSYEIAPAAAHGAGSETPSGALCARCRRSLRRNGHKVRAGRARARTAERDERGRFIS